MDCVLAVQSKMNIFLDDNDRHTNLVGLDSLMKENDINYVRQIPTIDINQIGQLINQGVHHRVYEYGRDEVLKVPRRRFNFLYSNRSHLEADLKLINSYFPELAVSTVVHSSKSHQHHCMIQEKVKVYTLIDPVSFREVGDDFTNLLQKNKQLEINHCCSLDLLGGQGLLSCIRYFLGHKELPYFSNTVLVKKNGRFKLRVIDTELLRLSLTSLTFTGILSYVSSHCSLVATNICLNSFYLRARH